MLNYTSTGIDSLKQATNPFLQQELNIISEKCINCELCRNECEFLRKYGKPKEIADLYDPSNKGLQGMPFECSLCQLCTAVCPVKINPAKMFLEMRRQTVAMGNGDYPEHAGILAYEKRGTSKRYSYYALPEGCDTILFPGCALTGTRPNKVMKLYKHLKQTNSSLGIVLDCCTKPSHDLGRTEYFSSMFGEMKSFLVDSGIRKVIVACPSCYQIFSRYGNGISVVTAYEFMSANGLPETGRINEDVTIHDSCSVRFVESIQLAVRDISKKKGLTISEMDHSEQKTLCCGKGSSVGFLAPNFAKRWRLLRKKEANGKRIITYCAGCSNFIGQLTPTSHILDILFDPEKTIGGNVKVSKAPFTYLNRLKLKKQLKNISNGAVTRERIFTTGNKNNKASIQKRILFLVTIIAAIFVVHITGTTSYLEQDTLRGLIQGYGTLSPLIYMLVYTLAPSLFLPGLPITIVGGILFGPFWGVVYTITSATMGACVAFLISRYVARDWIAGKLKSPRWRRLDQGVKQHGWKIVAFTRLIPLFPFNLLNYAFGLTNIKFMPYAIATFICMLPACIAFIVFSSSLQDIIKGKISSAFLIGSVLIIAVSLIPIFYNRYKSKKGINDPL